MRKYLYFKWFLSVFLAAGIGLGVSNSAMAGGDVSGGGSGLGLEFKFIAYNLHSYFSRRAPSEVPAIFKSVSLAQLKQTIDHCKVVPVDHFSDETSLDSNLTAKNYAPTPADPFGHIEVKEARWNLETQKAALVFHELLGIHGVDRSYDVSRDLYGFSSDTARQRRARIFQRLCYLSGRAIADIGDARIWASTRSIFNQNKAETCYRIGQIITIIDAMTPGTAGLELFEQADVSSFVTGYIRALIELSTPLAGYCGSVVSERRSYEGDASVLLLELDDLENSLKGFPEIFANALDN